MLDVFDVVLIMSLAATSPRGRNLEYSGQRPIRSRLHRLGFQELDSDAEAKVLKANTDVEISSCAGGLSCACRKVALLLLFPEAFGFTFHPDRCRCGLSGTCVSSSVSLTQVFLCRFAGADQRRPLRVLTNFSAPDDSSHSSLPCLIRHGHCEVPLPKCCPCVAQHLPMTCMASDPNFNTSQLSCASLSDHAYFHLDLLPP